MRNFRRVLFGALLILIIGGSFCLCGCDESYEELVAKKNKALQKYQNNPTEKNYRKYRKYSDKYNKMIYIISDSEELYNSRNEFWTIETNDNSNNIQENNKETLSEPIKEKIPETYEEWLAKAKEYESQKRWCYALGAYYDAMGMDIPPENKIEAYNGYLALEGTIKRGKPGFGTFNEFTLHDEWKNLLSDTKDYFSVVFPYEVTIGELSRGNLDYTTQTATYSAPISYKKNSRYHIIFETIRNGYAWAYESDWVDLPNPKEFLITLNSYIVKFNIVDDEYNEVFPAVNWSLKDKKIVFTGISPNVMDLIDTKKVFVAPYRIDSNSNFQHHTAVFMFKKNKEDKTYNRISNLLIHNYKDKSMINVLGDQIEMSKTEVTQELYESIMGENPSVFKGKQNPVENVSFYDAIYFCNKLSIAKGYEPVYYVNGSTNIKEWNYTPHQGSLLDVRYEDQSVNGYRLPTVEEWEYAAKGGQDYTYAGSSEIDEVAWCNKNSNGKTHPVAEKKANGYGLYDMSGNVWEWCSDLCYASYRACCGGSWDNSDETFTLNGYGYEENSPCSQKGTLGFRIVRTVRE